MKNSGDIPFTCNSGDRIAQIIVEKYSKTTLIESELNSTMRNDSGFGSKGISPIVASDNIDFLLNILVISNILNIGSILGYYLN